MNTYGRLRTKYGGTLEDCKVPETIKAYSVGFEFVSKIEKLPKELFNRFSMIYIPERCVK
jgi:hypothetical protein